MKRALPLALLAAAGCAAPTSFQLREELRNAYVASGFLATNRPVLYSELSASQGNFGAYAGHFGQGRLPHDREHDLGMSYSQPLDSAVPGASATVAFERFTFGFPLHAIEEPSLALAWSGAPGSASAKYVYSRGEPAKGNQVVLRAGRGVQLWGDEKPDADLAVQAAWNDHYFRPETGWAYVRSEAVLHLVQRGDFTIDVGAQKWDRLADGFADQWVGFLSLTIPLGSVGGTRTRR